MKKNNSTNLEKIHTSVPLLIDLLISNNFSSMTFFCATRILRVIGRQSKVHNQLIEINNK